MTPPDPRKYYSHVISLEGYPPPFDNEETRWPSFLGEFVAKIVKDRPKVLYWCSYYGETAQFRIFTTPEDYEAIQPNINDLLIQLRIRDTGAEKNETLVSDLAKNRFIGPDTNSSQFQRALLILESLNSVAKLLLDSIIPDNGQYWKFEANGDTVQNPIGNHFFSITHLYHNMTRSQAAIVDFEHLEQRGVLSYYDFQEGVRRGLIRPKENPKLRALEL